MPSMVRVGGRSGVDVAGMKSSVLYRVGAFGTGSFIRGYLSG